MADTPAEDVITEEIVEDIARRAAVIVAEQSATPEPWLTVEQAASHLGISTSQLYTLCSRRGSGFPVVKEGSRSYFKASALDAWRSGQAHL